jgi:SAM-dependent methyltransferase
MQNIVYDNAELARESACGRFTLATCQGCGHTYNSSFEPQLVAYDRQYNNRVPSAVMNRYYEEISDYLFHKYNLLSGSIVDVGCGKGTFLKILFHKYEQLNGIGIDPSYEDVFEDALDGRLTFIRSFFKSDHLHSRPALLVCRHVLEHIFDLKAFLESIHTALDAWLPVPFFIEVPDLNWIIKNNAFWDFCFEHCNYFTENTIADCLRLNGFEINKISPAFGGQYLWVEGFIEPSTPLKQTPSKSPGQMLTRRLQDYYLKEQQTVSRVHGYLKRKKLDNYKIVIWGMATKGVLFNYLIDRDSQLVDYCIDINQDKQGKYLPCTAKLISDPSCIAKMPGRLMIVIMNPNYRNEIIAQCKEYKIKAEFIDLHGI